MTVQHKDFIGSSYLESADYDSDAREMIVTFARSGDTAVYSNVPEAVWAAFTSALSPGSFLRAEITGRY